MTQTNFSRRSFLKGAGITAIGAAAMGALSGCGNGVQAANAESASASFDVRTQGTTTPSWLGEAPDVAESDITETLDYDVVVVGCRTGGLPAIISAAENGARVLGVDQQPSVQAPREDIGAINSRLQQEGAAAHPDCAIDKDVALDDLMRYSNGVADRRLLNVWADESGALVDWITDIITRNGHYKMNWEAGVGNTDLPERAWATSHSPEKLVDDKSITFGTELKEYAEEIGAEFRWNTSLIKCEQNEEGRVTGVICRDDNDKHYIRINASHGVILSTGGYAANTEMLEARQPWNQQIRINIPMGGGNSGDGIRAAMWCGAHMDPVGTSVLFNRAAVKPSETAGSDVKGSMFWFGEQPFLKVNLKGERFTNEALPYGYVLHAAMMQPGSTYVDIWDSNYFADTKAFDEHGCCRLYPWDNGAPSNKDISEMPAALQKLEDNGYVQRADTIEELAEKLDVPADTLKATWENYNAYAKAGHDPEFNKEPQRLIALDQPPYFGCRTGCWFLATIDGVRIDTNMHPIDDNGDPIQGLYTVGNDSGGIFCFTYPSLFVGFACGRTMTFGRRAGRLAATMEA
ncbi:MAG: FAD-binding protein [Denitrobacterium sp.]|nr:FAD-binding protein [Denitrobacterium sp.]